MASLGSKVLQIRSVEFAGKYHVPVRVLSSLTDPLIPLEDEMASGTLITFEEDHKMEAAVRSEEHTSELQSLMRISYAVFCLKKKQQKHQNVTHSKTDNDINIVSVDHIVKSHHFTTI